MHTVLEMTSGYVRYESSDVLVGEAKLFVPASLSKGRVRQMAQNSELTYWLGEVGMTVPNSPTEAEAEAFLQAMCDRIVLLWKTLPREIEDHPLIQIMPQQICKQDDWLVAFLRLRHECDKQLLLQNVVVSNTEEGIFREKDDPDRRSTDLLKLAEEGRMRLPRGLCNRAQLCLETVAANRRCDYTLMFDESVVFPMIFGTKGQTTVPRLYSHPDFVVLPREIGQMPTIQNISLPFDRLVHISSCIGMCSLTKLDLSHNFLTEIPATIGDLGRTLVHLNLSDNRISHLPESIGRLTTMQYCNLSKNRLKIIPKSMGNCVLLEALFLHNNPITDYPGKLLQLPALISLTLPQSLLHGDTPSTEHALAASASKAPCPEPKK